MKRFDTFGEYMFDLLFAPLKKGRRAANQFYVFFKVAGRVFDGLKKDALRVRDEANIVSASPVMLPVHGQDRDMVRLEGEDVEAYRTRLLMKGIIAKWSGTKRGILYVLAALGYKQAGLELVQEQHQDHWAEFIIDLGLSEEKAVRDFLKICEEVRKVKEGSSRLVLIRVPHRPVFSTIYWGGMITPLISLPVPELADNFTFRGAVRVGGSMAIQNRFHIPEAGIEGRN